MSQDKKPRTDDALEAAPAPGVAPEAASGKAAAGPRLVEGLSQHAGQYLTFFLRPETYGLRILRVKEIIRLMPITLVPKTPAFVRGVVNLRGKVIPVIDLRLKFGLNPCEDTEDTCIIVVDVELESRALLMGIVVDAVNEVLDVAAADIEPAPRFGASVETDFLLGMGKVKGRVTMLLDIDRVLTNEALVLESLRKEKAGGGA